MHRILTISRQFGSGGRTVGKLAAQQLGIPCYDQELIIRLAEESGFAPEYVRTESEYAPYASPLASAFAKGAYGGLSNQDQLWIAQQKIIRELGEKEDCVIVGRCADAILDGRADCLTAFIHASMEKRAERIVRVYGETEVPTEKRLRDKDKRRAAYYQFYTDRKWGDASHYVVTLDAGVLGIETCADILVQLYRKGQQK